MAAAEKRLAGTMQTFILENRRKRSRNLINYVSFSPYHLLYILCIKLQQTANICLPFIRMSRLTGTPASQKRNKKIGKFHKQIVIINPFFERLSIRIFLILENINIKIYSLK
jgi:hypothetical protein